MENLLNKSTQSKIKSMSYKEMGKFFRTILADTYSKGFKDGTKAGNNADFRIMLSEVLNETKGIGITLYDRIMQKAKEIEND